MLQVYKRDPLGFVKIYKYAFKSNCFHSGNIPKLKPYNWKLEVH